jgi:(1->4)-alpha-D-glucan 1-alpha-D-glucosylmutase
MREAKLATDWSAQNQPYESAARELLFGLLTEPGLALRSEIAAFADRIGPAGAVNGLLQILLKLTIPGVPDSYQGCEFWDLSLVDPDNRRPVDYTARRAALERGQDVAKSEPHWRDGTVKQALIAATLAERAAQPDLFSLGGYEPLQAEGPAAPDVVAFVRRHGVDAALVVGLRNVAARLRPAPSLLLDEGMLQNLHIEVPTDLQGARMQDALSGRQVTLQAKTLLADVLALPLALLVKADGRSQ